MQTRWQASLTLALCVMMCGMIPALSGATPVPLTKGPGDDTEAAWSPDGRFILFTSDRGGHPHRTVSVAFPFHRAGCD